MNALEAASLVMIPSGYENGTLGSLKPTDGTGDFTFSRGSDISATRVNEDGYIEKGYENRLLQSNQFDTTWVLVNDATLASGQTGYDGSSDAWLAEKSASSNSHLRQNISISGVYTFSLYAKSNTLNGILIQTRGESTKSFQLNLSTGAIGDTTSDIDSKIEDVGDGWWRISLTGNDSGITQVRIFICEDENNFGTIAGSIYIQDAMLNQGMVSYPYVETTTAPVAGGILEDEPRLDYSGSCASLKLEPQRTNLLRNSEALNISPNVVESVSYSYNEIASPSGFINAPKFSETPEVTAYRHGFYHYVSIPNGAITASIFTKQIDRRYVSLQSNATGSNQYSYVDLEDGSVVSEGTGWTLSTEDYGNGWWRIVATATGIQGSPYFIWGMSLNGTSNAYSGDGSEFTFWGGQIEAGSYPTSYIPTYGTSQTRLADNYTSIALSLDEILGNTQGTISYEFSNPLATSGDVFVNYFGSPNGGFARFRNYFQTSGLTGVTSTNPFLGDIRGKTKIAVSYGGGNIKMFTDGVENDSGTYTGDISLNLLYNPILNQTNESLSSTNSGIKSFILFPTALSDDECIELTTI